VVNLTMTSSNYYISMPYNVVIYSFIVLFLCCSIAYLHAELTPDPESGGVCPSNFEAVTAFSHTPLQHHPHFNLLRGRGAK
jgi:hypothetical protein